MRQARVAARQGEKKTNAPALDNRRARFQFHILESLEAGLALTGTEIKSIRSGGVSLNEAFARVRDGELWLVNMYIPPYKQGNAFSAHDPRRPRKLLVHREQLERLAQRSAEKGLTIVPLRLYFTRGMAKVEIGLAKGKKLYDKRATIQERETKRELSRVAR
ncbi:MAG: SsrA-binding protein SmpB [Candidatus Eremiobacteraeota bacterium]|nr:SsrA-binding protein SmpB [Candidatus Eremiobacteraeota bacterium]MBV8356176.1 SsrA-binding protein SmpB [Candidatus Eremiobacteraeota bacterium]